MKIDLQSEATEVLIRSSRSEVTRRRIQQREPSHHNPITVAPNEKLVVWFAALFELGAWIIDLQTRCAVHVIC